MPPQNYKQNKQNPDPKFDELLNKFGKKKEREILNKISKRYIGPKLNTGNERIE